jgi:hypothetical protein
MIKRSTFSDLLSYAYNESDLKDSDRIQREIDGDPLLEQDYKELTGTLNILDAATPEIDPAVIEKILKFC